MRRKIELYIGGQRADLDDQGLILYNYAFTDLEAPAAVKNSYSKQVTLPGTPANDAIFGHFARPDRRTAPSTATTGTAFNPGKKTPFAIYGETGDVLECGYCRLDSVVRKGRVVSGYKVSLFGGLGEFFANLSYNDNGDKRTLADLAYLESGTGAAETELDFTINLTSISNAWTRLYNYPVADPSTLWDVINFAPCYNGIPDGDFSPDKGVVNASNVGLDTSVEEDDKTYETQQGSTLINLPSAVDEWAAKDLRSYLQRPVISMRAILKAIADPLNNGGYAVDYSAVPGGYYKSIWKTLPMLTSLGSGRKIVGTAVLDNLGLNYPADASENRQAGKLVIDGIIPQGMQTRAAIRIKPILHSATAIPAPALETEWTSAGDGTKGAHLCVYFLQAVAYNGNTPIGGSPVRVISTRTGWDWSQMVEDLGFSAPLPGTGFERAIDNPIDVVSGDNQTATFQNYMDLEVETAFPPTQFKVFLFGFYITTKYDDGQSAAGGETIIEARQPDYISTMNAVATNMMLHASDHVRVDEYGSTLSYESRDGIRSGSRITKALLLQSKYSPAEYLISWAKTFGLVFLCNQKEKKVTIMPRNDFFATEEATLDLSERIDRGKDITIAPMNITTKWYEMRGELAGGAFAQEYKALYGVDYGIQRIDTGYDFDAAAKNIMDGNVFRQAVTKLAHGRYWEVILVNTRFRPSPFLDKGVTYTLWEQATGEAKTFPVPGIPTSATQLMYNADHDYYDVDGSVLRLDLADKDGKPVDGEDILVRYSSGTNYKYFKLTDDTAAMIALNDGKPCWNLGAGTSTGLRLPTFAQLIFGDGADEYNIGKTLNYGTPREVDIPGCYISVNSSLYARYWRSFITDRLDVNTKVMKCRVHFRGLRVGPELLRRFYWYEGALWVLNKITNYSLTTWDPVECEFIQVQDVTNYTEGQITD